MTAVPRLSPEVLDDLDRRLASADAERAARYPGDAGSRQPVHTVYVPADQMAAGLPADWGRQALAALAEHAGSAAALAQATGIDPALVDQVLPGVLAKLEREPVEDLRLDCEDGDGPRPPAEADTPALGAARALAGARAAPTPPPHSGQPKNWQDPPSPPPRRRPPPPRLSARCFGTPPRWRRAPRFS